MFLEPNSLLPDEATLTELKAYPAAVISSSLNVTVLEKLGRNDECSA
jgi:hypothetical protein